MISQQPPGAALVPSIFTNELFLKAAFGPDWPRVKVVLIAGDPEKNPDRSIWNAYPAEDYLKAPHAHLNTYFSVGVQTGTSRGLAGFERIRVIVLDDVGVKVDLKAAIDILGNPSYILETSPGNCQAGWFTDIGNRDWALGLTVKLYEALGQTGDNLKNLVGLMRLPVGTNCKAKCGPGGFRHRLKSWNPDTRIDTLDWIEIERRIGQITPIASHLSKISAAMPDPAEAEADAILQALRMLGRVQGLGRQMTMGWGFDIECPWIEEHSERAHEGTSYVPVHQRFHCHHGHCQDRGMGEVRERLTELLKEAHGTTLAALEFDDVDPTVLPKTAVGQGLAGCEQTEAALADAFVDQHRWQLRFDHRRGHWYRWTGGYWQENTTDLAFHWAKELLKRYRGEAQDAGAGWIKQTGKIAMAGAIERAARAHPALAVDGSKTWDLDPWLAGAPGCEIDLRTGQVFSPDPRHMITKQLLVAPDFTMATPVWDQFLWDSTAGDPELIEFLRAWAGYCLTGDTSEEKFVFIYGPGGRGKGTFLRTINEILNDYAAPVAVEMFMVRKFDAHPEEVASLFGVRSITTSEISAGQTFNIVRLKDFTGRDGKLKARFMRQDSFSFTPQFKVTFVGNDQPRIPVVDDAVRRRLILVPFTHEPPVVDTALKDKLVAEYPGVLAWMIEGENRRRAVGGLPSLVPSVAVKATDAYLEEEDSLKAWATERCVFSPTDQMNVTEGFEDYRSWCFQQGTPLEIGRNSFSRKFVEKFSACKKKDLNTGAVIKGVSLKPDPTS